MQEKVLRTEAILSLFIPDVAASATEMRNVEGEAMAN
jgi:hypothetical protein